MAFKIPKVINKIVQSVKDKKIQNVEDKQTPNSQDKKQAQDTKMQNVQDTKGRTALHQAVIAGEHQKAAKLLKDGSNPNIADKYGKNGGFTPLYYAVAQKQDPLMIKILKQNNAELTPEIIKELERQSKADPLNRNLREIRNTLGFT